MNRFKKLIVINIIISTMMLTACNAHAEDKDWEEDFKIDKKLGLINQPWDIPFVHISSLQDLIKRINTNLPPYSQQPEKAQEITESLPTGAGDSATPH